MQEYRLLTEYKKYDYLNLCRECPLIKILVSYIKPSFLFKSEILTPIHLGRAVENEISKDGISSEDDLKWLHENCIGDNDFEGNISAVNRRVGFFTGTYWAWKNYEKLGNPEYFGSFGYRKLFMSNFLNDLKNYDLILPKKTYLNLRTNKTQFIDCHSSKLYSAMYDNLKKIYPEMITSFDEYLNMNTGYYHEIFILKKQYFFAFCEWINLLVMKCLSDKNCFKELNNNIISPQNFFYLDDLRDIAFIMEIYTGFYFYWLKKNVIDLNVLEVNLFESEKSAEKKLYASKLLGALRNNIKRGNVND